MAFLSLPFLRRSYAGFQEISEPIFSVLYWGYLTGWPALITIAPIALRFNTGIWQAWQETLFKRGVNFTEEDFKRGFGQRNEEIIRHILGEEVSQDDINIIADEKEANFRQRLGQNLKPLPGVIKLMEALAERGFKMALASSTPVANLRLINERLGIAHYFQGIIAADDVTEGKPSPQAFLLAAHKLGIEPGNCLVVEDAVAGVTAARKALMPCLAVTNTNSRASLNEADLVVDTLEDISVENIMELLSRSHGSS